TGGASAVYGADAVSGVVNFILKKKYEGANLHAQIGDSQHGSFGKQFISVTGGGNFAEDRGNYALSFEHSQQDDLQFPDRFGHQAYRGLRTPGTGYDTTLLGDAGNYTITKGGTFSLGSNFNPALRYVFDAGGKVRKQRFDGAVDRNSNATCSNCDRLDGNQDLQLQPKYKRDTISAVAGFDLNQDHRLYFEGMYSKVSSKSHFSSAFGATGNPHIIERDNAYMTPELLAIIGARPSINVARNDVDSGFRGEDTDRQTARVVFGAEGAAFGSDSNWLYDVSVNYGRTHERRRNLNNRVLEKFYAGLDAVK
ncbi:TonB-dependent receptor, partial [Lysobacter sp. 2RAB21]